MRDKNNNQTLVVKILVVVIVVLLLVGAYFFIVQPGVNKFVYNKQIEGVNFAYADVVNQVQQQGYFALPLGQNEAGEDQTLVLVPYVAPQAQAPTQ
ncbi:hypothetical protein HOD29_04010 [archaeon]|nr:hypothetical protein [archaeon]